ARHGEPGTGREAERGIGPASGETEIGDHHVHDRTDAAKAGGRVIGVFRRSGEMARVSGKEEVERDFEGILVMSQEQMEFLISQHLDGTISPEDEAILRKLLETSEDARRLLGEYQKLDEVMKGGMPVPQMRWEKVGEMISSAVSASEDDEIAISEYIDGGLS